MAEEIKRNENSGEKKEIFKETKIRRRTVLKALAGLPVLGVFGYSALEKKAFDDRKRKSIIVELGLDDIKAPALKKSGGKSDLIRIGVIGFGVRAGQLANALGFMHPEDVERRKARNTFEDWLQQEPLNIAITGICDVYDVHAERGMATAMNENRPGGGQGTTPPVKRYRTYQEMLADKDIDAVIIATPDHHHARMTIDAAKAGKHIYCEKSPALTEAEINEVYQVVKSSNVVYQLGHQITQNVIFQQAKEIIRRDILGKISIVETTTNRNSADGAWVRHLDAKGNPKPFDEKAIDWEQWLGTAPKVPFSVERFYSWVKWFDYDTGVLGQLFTHEYDSVNQLLRIGIPKSAIASGGIYYWKDGREMPDVFHAVWEYPERDLTLFYSSTLSSSLGRGRVFIGHDASMELGSTIQITADNNSTRYKKLIQEGKIDTSVPMISISPGTGSIDAVTSPSEKYYASRGLTTTTINGRQVDVTHLHLKQWLDCIRNGETPTCDIEKAFEEGITYLMAHKSYVEKRRVEWDPIARKIV